MITEEPLSSSRSEYETMRKILSGEIRKNRKVFNFFIEPAPSLTEDFFDFDVSLLEMYSDGTPLEGIFSRYSACMNRTKKPEYRIADHVNLKKSMQLIQRLTKTLKSCMTEARQ